MTHWAGRMKALLAGTLAMLPSLAHAAVSCVDPQLLQAVKHSIAERRLDDTILRGSWSMIATTNFPGDKYEQCFGTLYRADGSPVGPFYYGWRYFDGQVYVRWRRP